jgi:hypothetical protein
MFNNIVWKHENKNVHYFFLDLQHLFLRVKKDLSITECCYLYVRSGLVRPPYIYNGFLATLEMADMTDQRNMAHTRHSGHAKKNMETAGNRSVRLKMEPSVQQGAGTFSHPSYRTIFCDTRVGIHSCLFADFSMDLRKCFSQSCLYIRFAC